MIIRCKTHFYICSFQAVKLGSQANELATDFSSKMSDRVLKPAQQKLSDRKVVNDITSSMTSWASKVLN